MKRLLLTGALLGLLLSSARAQSLDYDAFEQMFDEPVTDSVTGQPQRVSEAPASIEIITADDIRRSGADNIPDVLQFVTGLDVRRYGQLDAAVGVRGDNTALNPRVLVLLDGRQVYDDGYGQTVWALIPVALSDIRQIEIIKGPNAALYGFNAVSGVINIVTYDPLRHQKTAGFADGGSLSQIYGEGTTTVGVPGQYGIRVSAAGFHADEFLGSQAEEQREAPRSGTLAIDSRVQVLPDVQWDLSGSFGSLQSEYFVDLGLYAPVFSHENDIRTELKADTAIGLLDVDVYRNENDLSEQVPLETLVFRDDVLVLRASDLFKIGTHHTIRVAAEYRNNMIASLKAFDGILGYNVVASSGMWAWQVTPRLSLTNAIRIDALSLWHHGAQFYLPTGQPLYQDESIVEPSFNSGAVIDVTPVDTIRLIVARAVQIPSLLDFGLSGSFDGGAVLLSGRPELQPSAATNYEADYDRSFLALPATLRLAAFAQHTSPTIGSPFGSGFSFLPTGQLAGTAQNFGASDEAGGEIELKSGGKRKLHWMIGYALAAVHDATPSAILGETPSVSYQQQTPINSVTAALGYSWQEVDLDLHARWQSHYEDDALNFTDLVASQVMVRDYVTLDARIAYRVTPHVQLSAVAEQLIDQAIVETAGVPVDRRFLAGVKVQL